MNEYEAAEYMVASLAGQQHPALLARPGTGVIFDGTTRQWVSEPQLASIYQDALKSRDTLVATANAYRKKTKQPLLDISPAQNWKDVEKTVQEGCEGFGKLADKDKDMSGSLGRLKSAFRSLCQNAGAGQTVATLVPNDGFGFASVLSGSLKTIFAGLRATAVYRQEVYRTLEDLPVRLKDLAADVKLQERNEEVHRRAARLYVAVFGLLNHILLWFMERRWLIGAKILMDPTGFIEKLRDYQAELKLAAQSFEALLNRFSREAEQTAVQLQYWTAYHQAGVREQLEQIKQEIAQHAEEERSLRIEVLEKLGPLLSLSFLNVQDKAIATLQGRLGFPVPVPDPDEFLSHFLYDSAIVGNDCATLRRHGHRLARANHDDSRLVALQKNSRLRSWLIIDEPSALLLSGRTDPRMDSESSFFAAQLYHNLLESTRSSTVDGPSILPLAFFCGQHQDWRTDDNGNAEELAMNLLLQLVDGGHSLLDAGMLQKCYDTLNPQDLSSILSSLEAFIRSLPPSVFLVVIIDGLQFFTHPPDRRTGTRNVVEHLMTLYRTRPAATLKLLFSSPTRSDFVEDLFAEEEVLELPRSISSIAIH